MGKRGEFQKPVADGSKSSEPSGAEKVKRKQILEEETKRLREQAAKHFKFQPKAPDGPANKIQSDNISCSNETVTFSEDQPNDPEQCCDNNAVNNSEISQLVPPEPVVEQFPGSPTVKSQNSVTLEVISKPEESMDTLDPSSWKHPMSLDFKKQVITSTASYSLDRETIKNKAYLYWKNYVSGVKPNGEPFIRDWIRISLSSSSVFFLPCCVFCQSANSPWSASGGRGFHDFNHGLRGVSRHEESSVHLESMRIWKRFLLNSSEGDLGLETLRKERENEWRLIFRGILDALLFLAEGNLAFQGKSHYINDENCGNFLRLIKLLAKYYAPLSKHLESLKKGSTSYLSPGIQNEFLLVCGSKVKTRALQQVRENKYFSILFDSTSDISHHEQISQIIRCVSCSKAGCKVQEYFIDFISTTSKTGEDIARDILKKLEEDNLQISNGRGQGYDNGANMSGAYSGVQAQILKRNPFAKFVPCAAHSLNLVGVNACEKTFEAKLILGTIQNLYSFFAHSTSRWEILMKHVKATLKSQSATRWSSKAQAVSSLWNNFTGVVDALNEIINLPTTKADVVSSAQSRLRDILNFKFILGLSVWNQILHEINYCSKRLQSKDIDLEDAAKHVKLLCKFLEFFKETGFKTSLEHSKNLASSLDISEESGFENVRRGRGVNPRYDDPEKVSETRVLTNFERFQKEMFDALMSNLEEQMKKRFIQMKDFVSAFSFLWGKGLALHIDDKRNAVKLLCEQYPNDLSFPGFLNEILSLKTAVKEFAPAEKQSQNLDALEVLNILYKNSLDSTYINCGVALRIFLSLPVSVATNERSFSKLKLIKNYLRSAMGQERLNNLAIISIEKEIVKSIDFDEIINDFVAMKNRKIAL